MVWCQTTVTSESLPVTSSNSSSRSSVEMSKDYDIKHSIIYACKQHGTGLQLAIDLNWAILNDLDWVDDEEDTQQDSVFKMWKDYDKD